MNACSVTLLSLRAGIGIVRKTAPRASRCPPRTVPHLCRTMAAHDQGYTKPSHDQGYTKPSHDQGYTKPSHKTKDKPTRRQNQPQSVDGPCQMHLQVVGSGSRGDSRCISVLSEFNSYLFNCGERTQRGLQEHGLRLSRLDKVFVTQMSWENVGGLSGIIATVKDIGVPKLVLVGPPQLENFVQATKHFAGSLHGIELQVHPCTEVSSDNTMTVHPVPIFARPRSPRPASPGDKRKDPTLLVAFVCRLKTKSGRFLVEEAVKLGLPLGTPEIGVMIRKLKQGESVAYKGQEIRPEQVCTPPTPGSVFIVVECPSEEFLKPVCENPQLAGYHSGGTEDAPKLVIHLTPESILRTDEYREWMERFPPGTEHLLVNESAIDTRNTACHKIQTHLHMIHPQVFPELRTVGTKEPPAALQVSAVRAERSLKYQLCPALGWQRDAISACSAEHFLQEAAEIPNFLEEAQKCRRTCTDDSGETLNYPEVVFLGTGSSVPNKLRNLSGTLVNISPSRSLLLDCGEGTFGQLCQHYGDDVDQVLSRISTVFISHMHADHHTGLLKLLLELRRTLTTLGRPLKPVFLLAPVPLMTWLCQYNNQCEDIALDLINHIPNDALLERGKGLTQKTLALIEDMLRQNELQEFRTCYARHQFNSFACSFKHQSGWKVAFSGDTMPCEAFVNIGKDATLLIHEATLQDGMEDEALSKRHSTTSQAINIGIKMNADFIMLNHFSQRYAKIPVINERFTERVGISFDHMQVRLSDLRTLHGFIPALKMLYNKEIEEMDKVTERLEWMKEQGLKKEPGPKKGLKKEPGPKKGLKKEPGPKKGLKKEQGLKREPSAGSDPEQKRLKTN